MAKDKSTSNKDDFAAEFLRIVNDFLEILPAVPLDPAKGSEAQAIAVKLRHLFNSLPHQDQASSEKTVEIPPIVIDSLERLDSSVRALGTLILAREKRHHKFDDVVLFNDLRDLDIDQLTELLRLFTQDPLTLNSTEILQYLEASKGLFAIPIEVLLIIIKVIITIISMILRHFFPDYLPDEVAELLALLLLAADGVIDLPFGTGPSTSTDNGGGIPPLPGGSCGIYVSLEKIYVLNRLCTITSACTETTRAARKLEGLTG